MKTTFKSLLTIAIIAISASANAEVKYGLKAGVNLGTAKIKYFGEKAEDIKMKPGFLVGAFADLGFSEAVGLETGIQFEQKGAKYTSYDYDYDYKGRITKEWKDVSKLTVNYLSIPFDLKYNVSVGSCKAFLLAGPNIGIGLSGKVKDEYSLKVSKDTEVYEYDISFGNKKESEHEDGDDLKRLNLCLDLGAGYELSNNLGFRFVYNLGLSNLTPGGNSDYVTKLSALNFSVTYKF